MKWSLGDLSGFHGLSPAWVPSDLLDYDFGRGRLIQIVCAPEVGSYLAEF